MRSYFGHKDRQLITTTVLIGVAVLLVSSVRSDLFQTHKRVRQQQDVYFLPPPKQVKVMSLGYTAAVADMLWAHVMVSQGLHSFERRRFDNLNRLYDTVNELDPTWRTPYVMADALITFQSAKIPLSDVVKARQVLERGTEHLPNDAEIWLNLGQFVSFIAPGSYIEPTDPAMAEQWRREGVRYLQRAAELGAGDSNISWQALGGAVILREELGELDASVRYYERVYAITDDPTLRADIEAHLTRLRRQRANEMQQLAAAAAFERTKARHERFRVLRRHDLPLAERDETLLLGPSPRPATCAGPGHEDQEECATTWNSWTERFDTHFDAQPAP